MGPAGITKQQAIELVKGCDAEHAKRVQATFLYTGTVSSDWSAIGVTEFAEVDRGDGNMVPMPVFNFPVGYSQVETPWSDGDTAGNTCCHLCSHPIKNAFFIQNDSKKWTMVVGSECVTHFGEGDNGEKSAKKSANGAVRSLVADLESVQVSLRAIGMYESTERNAYGSERVVTKWATHTQVGADAREMYRQIGEALEYGKKLSKVTARDYGKGHPCHGEWICSDRILANWKKEKWEIAKDLLSRAKQMVEQAETVGAS